ncbi:MAG: hypothetical protein K4H23_04655, partial [Mollicutes bacterium PWAP]|nr:hypothetical protein [Mollicutes bacterium PWAP]
KKIYKKKPENTIDDDFIDSNIKFKYKFLWYLINEPKTLELIKKSEYLHVKNEFFDLIKNYKFIFNGLNGKIKKHIYYEKNMKKIANDNNLNSIGIESYMHTFKRYVNDKKIYDIDKFIDNTDDLDYIDRLLKFRKEWEDN